MRRGTAFAVLVLLLVGATCDEQPPAPETSTDDVVASREALGDPMVGMAEAVIALAEGMDEARHRVRRGGDMRDALGQLRTRRDAVAPAVKTALDAVADAPVEEAGAVVESAAKDAQRAADAATDEIAFLADVSRVDEALVKAAATWDQPGSQSEIRARLLEVADDVDKARAQVARLRPQPRACDTFKRNRIGWARTVRQRTLELQVQANSAGGTEFDRLRRVYRALPFGEEPRTADRKDRSCWIDKSAVAAGAEKMRAAAEELESTLSG